MAICRGSTDKPKISGTSPAEGSTTTLNPSSSSLVLLVSG